MPDQYGFRLPDLNLRSLIGGKDIGRLGLELLTGQRSPQSIALHAGVGLLGQLLDRSLPDASAMAGQAAEWMHQGRSRWENWLRTVPQATIAIIGGKGEGKTTCAFDILDRFIAPTGRAMYAFGVPQSVLPPGMHELSILKLRQMGVRLKANPDLAGVEIARLFRLKEHPEGFVILLDDASIYLNAKAHQKPEALALQTIVNVARHFRGIVLATFQNSRDVGRSLVEVDALVASRPNLLMMGPGVLEGEDDLHTSERDEIQPWMDRAAIALANLQGDEAVLTKYVACFARDVMWAGPWKHRRPAFYDEALSRNKAVVPDYDEEPDDIIDGEYTSRQDTASGRYFCSGCRAVHWTASAKGQAHLYQAQAIVGDSVEVKG